MWGCCGSHERRAAEVLSRHRSWQDDRVTDGDPGELVLLETGGGVATVTLNRPGARNALSSALRRRLRAVMAEVDTDDSVSAVILTGADPAFCAGLDLKELSARGGRGPEPDEAGVQG